MGLVYIAENTHPQYAQEIERRLSRLGISWSESFENPSLDPVRCHEASTPEAEGTPESISPYSPTLILRCRHARETILREAKLLIAIEPLTRNTAIELGRFAADPDKYTILFASLAFPPVISIRTDATVTSCDEAMYHVLSLLHA